MLTREGRQSRSKQWGQIMERDFWKTRHWFKQCGLILVALLIPFNVIQAQPSTLTPPPPNTGTIYLPHRLYLPLITHQRPPSPPQYHLTIDPADLAWLYDEANIWNDETVPAIFQYQDEIYDVGVRFRGGTARYHAKKSWKIDFPASTPFQGQRELNLNAEYTDKSLLREALAYDLFKRAGLPTPDATFVQLTINDQTMGVYLQVEHVDKRFLDRIGWDPNGNLYKGNYDANFDWRGFEDTEPYVKKTNKEDSHADLMRLLWLINITPDAEFPEALASAIDIGQYLDWYALQIALGNYEWLEKNYYIYHHLGEDWWAFLPWDLDLTLGHNWGENGVMDRDISWDNPIDSGTTESPKADGVWNKLITRVLRVEAFRFAYCRRLQKLLDTEFSEDAMFPRIDAYYGYIAPYAEADVYKWGNNEDFHAGPEELKTYISQRRAWLMAQVPLYCPPEGPMPVLNELMPKNTQTVADEAGDYDPWIELYNPGLVTFDASGMILQVTLTGTLALQWTLPEGTVIPPQSQSLIWVDGEPDDGPLHTPFRLRESGTLQLRDTARYEHRLIDEGSYKTMNAGTTLARWPDGADHWITTARVTPGWSNMGRAPSITGTTQTPLEPTATQSVTIMTNARDPDAWASLPPTVTLQWYARLKAHTSLSQTCAMWDDGLHNDGAAGDRTYGAHIPPLESGTVVTYYIKAKDAEHTKRYAPAPAPERFYRYVVGFQRPPLYLNEVRAINAGGLEDEAGESHDWFEVYNAGPDPILLDGMYLTDALEDTTKWQIPSGVTAPAGGWVIFWADDEPDEGPTHTNFKLDGDGERLALYANEGNYNELIDEVYYGPQETEHTFGRYPDGSTQLGFLTPTPGQANHYPPPRITWLDQTPAHPDIGQTVTISVELENEGTVPTATLYYSTTQITNVQGLPMQRVSTQTYSVSIPGQEEAITVAYYVEAQDIWGNTARVPHKAPNITYGYLVNSPYPALFINEFLASNNTVIQDEQGEYEDWVELFNANNLPQDLGDLCLTDDLSNPAKWCFPDNLSLSPHGHMLIWTDGEPSANDSLHTNFKLDKEGEEIGLFRRQNSTYILIDHYRFGPQIPDVSMGRQPDGDTMWHTFKVPTPGQSNTLQKPSLAPQNLREN